MMMMKIKTHHLSYICRFHEIKNSIMQSSLHRIGSIFDPITARSKITTTTHRRCRMPSITIVAAKKGGSNKKGQKKASGSPADPPKQALPFLSTPVIMQNLLMIESYFRKTSRPLFDENQEIDITEVSKVLWEAPFAVLAHDTSEPDPLFVYGNKAALDLFECTWDELIGTPSKQSAENVDEIQQDRSQALAAALEKGFIDNYQGWRTSFKGNKFLISNATVFNIEAPSGARVGQGAVLRNWEYEDGRKGGVGVVNADETGEITPPSEEQLKEAEIAVNEQAQLVRDMKEVQGLSNSSEEVQNAVAVLMERKETLEKLKKAASSSGDNSDQ